MSQGLPLTTICQQMVKGISSFSLMAVPFFITMGCLMAVSYTHLNLILDGHTLGAIQVIITDEAWDKLTPEQQDVLTEAGKYASG